MAKKNSGSVAPKERINISYKPATGNARETVELPFKLVVLGDFTNKQDDRTVEDRAPVEVNKHNFDDVMKGANLSLQFSVDNHLSQQENSEISVDIPVQSLKDLEPDSLMKLIPELRRVHELRESLMALKGPLGNSPQMRRTIMAMIQDKEQRGRLMQEIGLR
ncbi:Protein of unknown function (DUF770) [gamma proteobacterium HdN1]|nr:Protein of unknown function (DUF770) [gamma proteobacterium HdN1]